MHALRLPFLFVFSLAFYACSSTKVQDNASNVEHQPGLQLPVNDSLAEAFPPLQDPLFFFWGNSPDSTPHDTLHDYEIAQLQEGDIVLRKGYGAVSDFIAIYLNEDYPVTHCAFFLREGYPEPTVLHTVSNDNTNGVFTEPLRRYVEQSKVGSIAVVRLKGEAEKKREVLAQAKDMLRKGIKFDMGFNDNDTTEMYCAEMMRHIFKKVYNEDLLSKRAQKYGLDVIHMNNFFNPQYFETVLNRFDTLEQKLGKTTD